MTNMVLLSGLDGTGILFEPFIQKKPASVDINFMVYHLNEQANQSIEFQCTFIEEQIRIKFGDAPVVIIAESYSGLLGYELVKRQNISIKTMVFVACFLQRPFYIARFAGLLTPNVTNLITDKLLAYALFNRFYQKELMVLFRQSMSVLQDKETKQCFKARCKNIATASLDNKTLIKKNDTTYVYLQAKQDMVINKKHALSFVKLFERLKIHQLNGTHFLLQTNPKEAWHVIEQYI